MYAQSLVMVGHCWPVTWCSASSTCRFGEAIRAGRISKVEQIDHCCVLAAVGHQMASRKGVAATMFSALAKANINIRCALQLTSALTGSA